MKDELRLALNQIGAAQASGEAPRDILKQVLDYLSELPPSRVTTADFEIAREARLWPDIRRPGLIWPNVPDRSASTLLRRQPEMAWLFIFHRDGYQREAALNLLSGSAPSPFLLAAIAWRLNDWVPQVRRAARRAFSRIVLATPLATLAAVVPFFVLQTRSWLRWEPESAMLPGQMLARPDVVEALGQWFLSATSGPVGQTLQLMLQHEHFDSLLPILSKRAVLPTVRGIALRTLIQREATWQVGFEREWIDKVFGLSRRVPVFHRRQVQSPGTWEHYIEDGLHDRSVMVRRIAADALSRDPHRYPRLEEALQWMARDRSSAIRARAEFLARQDV